MRYISKNINSPAFTLLNDWNKLRKKKGQKLSYIDFDNKPLLNDILREEQGGICCYCQQKISHFQGDNKEGSHNEHLFPEKGKNNPKEDRQTDYFNLYACCNYSKGMKKNQQHCGEAKHDEVIYEFIKCVDCNTHFKYNSLGDIIPQGIYNTIDEFERNKTLLTFKQKEVLRAIKILNLNQSSLVEERKKDLTALLTMLTKLTKQQVQAKMQVFNQKPYKYRFVDMLLYYMKQKK
ncbi:HNH endonuclease family protein [Viscerimonas tarda]